MQVEATELVRKMRGGAGAWLARGSDDQFYVVKFRENMQHPRILANEWIATRFLKHLQLCAADAVLVRLGADSLEAIHQERSAMSARLAIQPVSEGLHFGSRVPVNPDLSAMYDFVPDSFMERIVNRHHFHGMLAFDQWVCNADTRQAVYFRGRLRDFLRDAPHAPGRSGMIALMIDHGYAFQGPDWQLDDLPRQGVYPRPAAYAGICGWDDFEPWLSRIVHFPESVVDEALKTMPSSWFLRGETDLVEALLEKLLRRARRVPDLIAACRSARPELFPNWQAAHAASGN